MLYFKISQFIQLFLADLTQLTNKLDAFVKQTEESRISGISKKKTIEEFKIIFKYLAFVACSAKAPIRQKMLDAALDLINKAGSAENIQLWCQWTPLQLSLMEMADRLTRVVLTGGNGTGKTLMLETYVLKTAKENPDDAVIFAIQQRGVRPLLQLQFEVRFEELQNVTVKTFVKLSDLDLDNCSNTHICMDEVNVEEVPLEDLQKIQAKSIWTVIRDPKSDNPEEDLKEKLPGWHIVNLTHPLRTSKNISIKVKESGERDFTGLGNEFNGSLDIGENMPLGPEPLVIPSSKGSYKERCQLVFNTVAKDKSAFIIIDYSFGMSPTAEEIQEAKQSTTANEELAQKTDKYSQNLLVGIEAVKACDRPKPPLIWLRDSRFDYVSDDKENIKAMMRGSKDFIGCDLITDPFCVAGIEADLVIFLGPDDYRVMSDFMSRCQGQFVQIE